MEHAAKECSVSMNLHTIEPSPFEVGRSSGGISHDGIVPLSLILGLEGKSSAAAPLMKQLACRARAPADVSDTQKDRI